MPALWRPLVRLYLTVRHRIFGRRHGRLVLERTDGMELVVLPTVFNPVLFRTGALLARAVTELHGDDAGRGLRALDMGTGTGIGAVAAARRGFEVVAVDVNPDAVRCARINALLNRVEGRVEARRGDLFEPLGDARFDLVLFNPPFFRGTPDGPLDTAWRSPDVLERFARDLPSYLEPGGRALVVLSTDGEGEDLLSALGAAGLGVRVEVRRDLGNEVLTVYSASPQAEASDDAGSVSPRDALTPRPPGAPAG